MKKLTPLLRIVAISRATPESTVYLSSDCARSASGCYRLSGVNRGIRVLGLFQGEYYALIRTEGDIPEALQVSH